MQESFFTYVPPKEKRYELEYLNHRYGAFFSQTICITTNPSFDDSQIIIQVSDHRKTKENISIDLSLKTAQGLVNALLSAISDLRNTQRV